MATGEEEVEAEEDIVATGQAVLNDISKSKQALTIMQSDITKSRERHKPWQLLPKGVGKLSNYTSTHHLLPQMHYTCSFLSFF